MQLDRTRIAIRERSVVAIFDLALHVVRAYARPLLLTTAMGVLPLMLLNQLLLGWILADLERPDVLSADDVPRVLRYIWNMSLLVFIEAPLASVFATAYLGQAVFLEQPGIWQNAREVLQRWRQLALCHLILRWIAPAWLMVWWIERDSSFSGSEVCLIFLAQGTMLYRAVRPFINEIVLLERNPLFAGKPHEMTVNRRSMMLHSPSSGDLMWRWVISALVGVILVMGIYSCFLFCAGALLNDWRIGAVMIQLWLPVSLWIVAGYMSVVRFLNYLDLRIRQEGWEVELGLRAEAARLASPVT